jgi:UDP-2-acetamido-3-amino-2,3-dideoxy-glucuronate N-acetyltransferase
VDTPVKVAVIGCGNWGKNLVRNFYNLEFLATICDLDKDLLAKIKKLYPQVQVTSRFEEILENPDIDAVVISTPSHTHYRLAKAALLAGKHVYVEKPIATSALETQELYTLSEHMQKILMVGHLLMYHPVVHRLKQLIEEGYLGEIRYIQSDRLNLNPHRADRSVFWDLAPHDLSMMMYILGTGPLHIVSVNGSRTSDDQLVDIAHLELEFPDGVGGHIHNSWVHPVKQVKMIVRGSERTAVMDDTQTGSGKLQVFSNNSPPEMMVPEYLTLEPLKLECQHFINCIRTGRKPKSDGVNGLEVVQILEEAERIIQQGQFVAKGAS